MVAVKTGLWPETGSGVSKAAQRLEKQHWAIEKPKLDNARKLRGIFHGEQRHHEKNDCKKLDSLEESAMPCKVQNLRHKEACGENEPNTRRSRYACIVEAHESTRKRLEKTHQKGHEDRVVEKGFNSLSHYSLV